MKQVKLRLFCISLFAFLFPQITIHAQTPPCQWASDIGAGSADVGLGVATFYNGDVYVTGKFSGSNVDFDPGAGVANLSSNGSMDVFVAKYNAAGQYQWAFNIGGASADAGNSIAVDIYGYAYITGFYDGNNVDFDPGNNAANLSSTGSNDVFLAKYSPIGQYQWAISMGGASASDEGYGVAVDDSSYVYITGSLGSTIADFDPSTSNAVLNTNGGTDIFLAKYSDNGQYLWAFNMGTTGNFNERGSAIACDRVGHVYITGQLDGTGNIDVDPSISTHSLTGGGSTDIFVAKYDVYGHYQWAFNIPGPNADAGAGICSDQWGNILVTGQFKGTLDFDPGAGVQAISSNVSSTDAFVASYTLAGQYDWAFALGSSSNADGGTSVNWDNLDNAVITGYFSATADFDPSGGIVNLTSHGMEDIYLAKYDNNGQYIWAVSAGNAGSDDVSRALSVTYGTNEPVITGDFDGTAVDFDPATATVAISSSGAQDIFLAKYASCWEPPDTPGDMQGPIIVCEGTTHVYSIGAVLEATGYTWTLPAGWSGNSNGTSITVTVGATSGTVSVTADNPCGSSPPATLTVTVSPPPVISYTQMPHTACVNDGPVALSPASPAGGTYGGPGVSGTSFNPSVAGIGYDTVTYYYTDPNGCTASYPQVINVSACTGVPVFSADDYVQVFPNPFDDQLTLIFSAQEKGEAILYDMLGKEVATASLVVGTNTIDTQPIASGVYVLKVITQEGIAERKLVKH